MPNQQIIYFYIASENDLGFLVNEETFREAV